MVREFAKPQEARAIEARARARCGGVRVAVIVEARRYCTPARSEPGTTYTIARTPIGWACACLGYFHTGVCKHLGAVERRAAREGWMFGVIAPLAQVARYMPLDPPTPDQEPDPEPPTPAGGAARPGRSTSTGRTARRPWPTSTATRPSVVLAGGAPAPGPTLILNHHPPYAMRQDRRGP